MNNLLWIDALRGLAIFSVLIYHTGLLIKGLSPLLQFVVARGESGVQLFYIVSALTLFRSMNNRKKSEKNRILNFFLRRFFRIAPLFYCAIAYYVLTHGIGPKYWVDDGQSITILNVFSHLTFTNGWNPYWINSIVPVGWSIAIEMPFYLLVPYLVSKIKSSQQAVWLTVVTYFISKFLSFILNKHPLIDNPNLPNLWKNFVYYWLPNQLPFFLFGIILYFLLQDLAIGNVLDKEISPLDRTSNQTQPEVKTRHILHFRRTMTPLLMLGLLLFTVSLTSKINIDYMPFLSAIGFVGLAVFLAHHSFTPIVNSFFCYLGKVSYGAYLIHLEILLITKNFIQHTLSQSNVNLPPTINFIVLLVIALAVSMAIASVTYQFIEKPGIALGRTLISRLEVKNKGLMGRNG